MNTHKHIQPGTKIGLKLTTTERKLILDDLMSLDDNYAQVIRDTPANQPVQFTLDDWDDFGGYIAAEANHAEDKKLGKKLHTIFNKIQEILDTHRDEEPPKTVKIEDARKAKVLSNQAVEIAEWAAKALVAAEQLGIKNNPLDHFFLSPAQRDVLLMVPGVSKVVKGKLAEKKASFTLAEVASMTMALAEDLLESKAQKQVALLLVAKHLTDHLGEGIVGPTTPKKSMRFSSRDSCPPRRASATHCALRANGLARLKMWAAPTATKTT
jgi:hypothetical protein